ncbi:SpoIID Sporulation protein and related proteins [Candidatus Nanopelagicaceae bacterium]
MKAARVLIALVLALTISPNFARAEAPAAFSFTGSGFGHGVGMSQIGAKARAVAGESATAILNYYYKDVAVTPVVDSHTIRVNIGKSLKEFSVVGSNASTVVQIYEGDLLLNSPALPVLSLASKQRMNFILEDKSISVGLLKSKALTIRWIGPSPTISLTQSGSTDRYRYGQIQVKVVKGLMEVTTSLSLHDEYLWGISEVPSNWPPAVLEAQAIAARSYALSKIATIKPSCDCHVYSHIADQNFVGFSKEAEPKIGKLWKRAVVRTNVDTFTSLAILSNGKPIQAYYSSSSGGATQTTLDAWGTATAYTQSVADPASIDPKNNPRFAKWNASALQAVVATAFLLPDIITLEIVSRNSAGAVTYIKGTSSNGSTKLLRGDTFRSRVKIPSPYFTLVS